MARFLKNKTIALLLMLTALLPAQADNTRVSLLTCSPGEEVYELFGHTALRYTDPDKKLDVIFGYGYFSFNTPNFVWRFILGETDYFAGAVKYSDFIEEYSLRGSGVTEQVISLDSLQKKALFEILVANCSPSSSTYRYNIFYNNCTTKVRDVLFKQVKGDITYSTPLQAATLRESIAQHTSSHQWTALGINLMLGADADKPATREVLQYLPAYFMNDLATAQAGGTPLVCEQTEILQPTEKKLVLNHFTPFNSALLLLLFTMIIMLCEVRSRKLFWGYDILLMGAQGISGVMLLFMALFSEHPAVGNNYLIILLNPVPLILIPALVYSTIKHKSNFSFMWIEAAIAILFIASAPFVPQSYPIPVFIFAIATLVRSLFHIYRLRICELSLY